MGSRVNMRVHDSAHTGIQQARFEVGRVAEAPPTTSEYGRYGRYGTQFFRAWVTAWVAGQAGHRAKS